MESAINSILANIKRCLRIRRYEVPFSMSATTPGFTLLVLVNGSGMSFIFFMQARTKIEFVRRLAQALTDFGLMVSGMMKQLSKLATAFDVPLNTDLRGTSKFRNCCPKP